MIGFPLKLQLLTSPDQLLLWMQIVFLWMAVNYIVGNDLAGRKAASDQSAVEKGVWKRIVYIRSVIFAGIAFLLPGIGLEQFWGRSLLLLVAVVFAILLPRIRMILLNSKSHRLSSLAAEWEILVNSVFIILSACLITMSDLHIKAEKVLFQLPISSNRLTAILSLAAGLSFLVRGGTHIVRGILDKFGAVPQLKTEIIQEATTPATEKSEPLPQQGKPIDIKEYNRGKMIGSLERVLIFIIILVGSYEALGFLIAGKGLIRAKEFEDRDFAEYFLLGTLTSTGVSLVIGLIINFVLKWLW